MRCFYHPDRDAVATCKSCGKGLCQECAAVYSPCSCQECVERNTAERIARHEQAKADALIDTNKEFVSACIKGVIASVVIVAFLVATNSADNPFTIGEFMLAALIFFFFPYGWAFLTWFRANYMPTLIVPIYVLLIFLAIKLSLSIVIGIPCFLFQLARFLTKRNAINKM